MMMLLLLQILIQLLLYIVIVNSSNDDHYQQCNIQLVHIIDIPTQGNAGFEYLTKDDKHYLLSANNVDYLVVSNEGILQSGLHQISQIFELRVVNDDRLEQIDS